MSLPQLSVRVAFASNPYDPTLTWTEIGPASGAGPGGSGWVRQVKSKRGRERLLRSQAQFQAGTATVTLDGRDRRFDPTNSAGPYWPNVQPEKVIQVGATWAGTFYPLWTGYVDDWPQNWPGFSEGEVPLVATDLFKALAAARVLSSGYPNQVIADGAVAYWRLGEPAGATIAADASGNGHTGTVNPSVVTFGQSGALPADPTTSAQFVGGPIGPAGSGITAPAGVPSGSPGVSIEYWYKSSDTSANHLTHTSVIATLGGTQFSFKLYVIGPPVQAQLLINGNGAGFGPTVTRALNDGNRHHLVGTVVAATGGSVGTCCLYMDGTLAATTGGGSGGGVEPWQGIFDINATSGQGADIQEVAVYPVALTAAQVANHYNLAAFRSQQTGQMVSQVMENLLAYPARLLNIDTGHTLCQQDTQSEVQTKVLDFLQKLEQTEQGQCYVNAAGVLTFEDRYHRYRYPELASLASLGDGGASYPAEIAYAMGGLTLNFDRAELWNDVAVTRRNGNLQEAANATSVTKFGNRAMQGLSDLLMETDLDALYCAEWILADTAFPQYRVGNLTIDPRVDDRWWPIVLGLDIGQVVTTIKHNIPGGGPPVDLVVRLEGVEHEITPPNGWLTTWHVSLTGTNPWLILDDPILDQLDVGNRWGW
jgi:hypothetical protein